MFEDIIASRGFNNQNGDSLNFFIEMLNKELFLNIDHTNEGGELALKLKITPQVLQELNVMTKAALEELETTSIIKNDQSFDAL
jgi:hypothetical protein